MPSARLILSFNLFSENKAWKNPPVNSNLNILNPDSILFLIEKTRKPLFVYESFTTG